MTKNERELIKIVKDYETREAVARFIGDISLREHGFVIVSRPKQGEPVWRRGEKTHGELEAQELVRQARQLEEMELRKAGKK